MPEAGVIAHPFDRPHLIPLIEIVSGSCRIMTYAPPGTLSEPFKKYGVTDFEFVDGHGAQSLDESDDSSLVPGGNCTLLKPTLTDFPTHPTFQRHAE